MAASVLRNPPLYQNFSTLTAAVKQLLYIKWNFPLRISLVNLNRLAVLFGLVHIKKEIYNVKNHVLHSVTCQSPVHINSEATTKVVLQKKVFLKILQIHRETPVSESLF